MATALNNKLLGDFLDESKTLVQKMNEILLKCEGNFSQAKSLETYGMNADRIMGAAKSLAVSAGVVNHPLNQVGDYAAICKIVGYKAALIKENAHFFEICVALLLDGTEVLESMLKAIQSGKSDMKVFLSATFIDRLRWISQQFGQEYSEKVDIHKGQSVKLKQEDIDELLNKLGF